jgi:hypothetical protein
MRETNVIHLNGKDRNKPCVCGSGRKYKICCGRENVRRIATLETPAPAKVSAGPMILRKSSSVGYSTANLTASLLGALLCG